MSKIVAPMTMGANFRKGIPLVLKIRREPELFVKKQIATTSNNRRFNTEIGLCNK